MKRFYLSDVIGTGTEEDPYRPSAMEYGNAREFIQLGNRMLCWAEDTEHASLIADPLTTYIPFEDAQGNPLPVTATLAEISTANRTTIRNWLEARNVPIADLTGQDTIRKLIRRVVQRYRVWCILRDDDVIEGLDLQVKDIPTAKRSRINTWLQARGYDTSFATGSMPIREFLHRLCNQDENFRYRGCE